LFITQRSFGSSCFLATNPTRCMGKQCPQTCSCFFGLLTFSCLLQYSTQPENCGFSQWVDPSASDPYKQYIDYLEDVVIYNLKRELSEALTSPDPSSSAGDDRCCKCSTCTCECHKMNSPPERLVTCTFTTSTPTWVLLHVIAC
jgi:hypothetical protein